MKRTNPKTSATVTPIASAVVTVVPPEGWKLHSNKYGFMRTDAGENLVSMIDIVKWLMLSRETHRPGAMSLMLDALTPSAFDWLYKTRHESPPSAYAVMRVDAWSQFGPEVPSRFAELHRRCSPDPELQRWLAQPTDVRELDLLKEAIGVETMYWLDNENQLADRRVDKYVFAILVQKAYVLWGYGIDTSAPHQMEPANYADLKEWRKRQPLAPWTVTMVRLLQYEVAARAGQSGVRKTIGAELNISAARVGQLLSHTPKRVTQKPGLQGVG